MRTKRIRRDSEDSGETEGERQDVDLFQLQVVGLLYRVITIGKYSYGSNWHAPKLFH